MARAGIVKNQGELGKNGQPLGDKKGPVQPVPSFGGIIPGGL